MYINMFINKIRNSVVEDYEKFKRRHNKMKTSTITDKKMGDEKWHLGNYS